MNFEQPNFQLVSTFPVADQMCYNVCLSPDSRHLLPSAITPLMHSHDVDFQPLINCPRKFVIFDQTRDRKQVMFNPEINPNFVCPVFGVNPPSFQGNINQNNAADVKSNNCSFKEDSDDIDALLSTEYGEQERCYDDSDDDVLSTARTSADYTCDSLDLCSNYETLPSGKKSFFKKSVGDRCNEKKRRRIRKIAKALKGIVPGANNMSTVSVLEEAVRYLKSLRVEVKKLGVENA